MLALPIALPVTLKGQISLESARMKREVEAALPSKFRSSMAGAELNLWGAFQFNKDGQFCKFLLSTESIFDTSFKVTFPTETFSRARYSIEHQAVSAWLEIAIQRRLRLGRELAHLADKDLKSRAFSGFVQNYTAADDYVMLQEDFLLRLRQAECELRRSDQSNHDRLKATEKAKPLRKLLEQEKLQVGEWVDTVSEDELKLDHYGADTIPKAIHPIYAYRRYHMDRQEGFPLFNHWGEPVSSVGKT